MGLFSWLFGRKKKKMKQMDPEQYIYFEPSKSTASSRGGSVEDRSSSRNAHRDSLRRYPITPKEATPKRDKKDSNYWDSQDFYHDESYKPGTHISNDSQSQPPSTSFEGFHAGSFAGGGASDSWDQRHSGLDTGSHGHQSHSDSSSHDTVGGHAGYDSGSSDSGGGD